MNRTLTKEGRKEGRKEGKERKGKERTGQDRTGQDRTGQDRTGQDRTGQDRTGNDRKRQERKRRERKGNDRKGSDRKGKGQERKGTGKKGRGHGWRVRSSPLLQRSKKKRVKRFFQYGVLYISLQLVGKFNLYTPMRCHLWTHTMISPCCFVDLQSSIRKPKRSGNGKRGTAEAGFAWNAWAVSD
jgi:hypothetical protein